MSKKKLGLLEVDEKLFGKPVTKKNGSHPGITAWKLEWGGKIRYAR